MIFYIRCVIVRYTVYMLFGIWCTNCRLHQVEDKMNKFHLLLVRESLNNEDVAKLANDNVRDCQKRPANNATCRTSTGSSWIYSDDVGVALGVMFSLNFIGTPMSLVTSSYALCLIASTEYGVLLLLLLLLLLLYLFFLLLLLNLLLLLLLLFWRHFVKTFLQ